MIDKLEKGGHFPTLHHEMLLKAALCPPGKAAIFFQQWLEALSLDTISLTDPNFISHFFDKIDLGSHRLLPLVIKNMGETGHPVFQKMKGIQKNFWLRNQQLKLSTEVFIRELTEHHIEHLIFKGLTLSDLYYPSIGTRPMEDGDVLIPIHEKEKVLQLIAQSQINATFYKHSNLIANYTHAIHLETSQSADVDLHWAIFSEYYSESLDYNTFWPNAVPHLLGSTSTKRLAIEDELFVAIAHGRSYGEVAPIRWVLDAMMIINSANGDIKWNRISYLYKQYRYKPFLAKAILYLKKNMDASIPANLIDEITSQEISEKENQYYKSISSNIRKNGLWSAIPLGIKRKFIYFSLFQDKKGINLAFHIIKWLLARVKISSKNYFN